MKFLKKVSAFFWKQFSIVSDLLIFHERREGNVPGENEWVSSRRSMMGSIDNRQGNNILFPPEDNQECQQSILFIVA